MRHRKRNIHFGRQPAHRKATVISLAANLIKYKRIETTLAKAKQASRLADRLITWAKRGALHHRRLAYSVLKDRNLVGILFNDLAGLFTKRNGGYTRVIHTRLRPGDGAQLAILEWTEKKKEEVKAKVEVKKKEKPKVEEKPKKEEKPETKHVEEKPKEHLKHEVKRPEAPHPTEDRKQKKGFLGGLRKLFGDRRRGEK